MSVVEALELVEELGADAPPELHAEAVGLVLSDDCEPGIVRRRRGRGWSFHLPDGTLVQGEERERCLALAVPPAWSDVWICTEAAGHLQAVGRDDAGRKQYRYHDAWRDLREATKFAGMERFGEALPRIRAGVDADLRQHDLTRERVLALAIAVLDATLLRVGSSLPGEDGARGLTTLAREHVDVGATVARFRFPGKSGQQRDVTLRDRRLARQLLQVQDHADHGVLAWQDDGGRWHDVRSGHVNERLRALAGTDVTAKDFRTWGGTVTALAALVGEPAADDEKGLRRQRLAAVDAAAARLGNTRAVARASYVHPGLVELHGSGRLREAYDDEPGEVDHLDRHERALLRLLRS